MFKKNADLVAVGSPNEDDDNDNDADCQYDDDGDCDNICLKIICSFDHLDHLAGFSLRRRLSWHLINFPLELITSGALFSDLRTGRKTCIFKRYFCVSIHFECFKF